MAYAKQAAATLFKAYAGEQPIGAIHYSDDSATQDVIDRKNFATTALADGRVLVLETKLHQPSAGGREFPPLTRLSVFGADGALDEKIMYEQALHDAHVSSVIERRCFAYSDGHNKVVDAAGFYSKLGGIGLRVCRNGDKDLLAAANAAIDAHPEWEVAQHVHFNERAKAVATADAAAVGGAGGAGDKAWVVRAGKTDFGIA